MAKRSTRQARSSTTAKRRPPARAKAKAVSGRDPTRSAEVPGATVSIMDAQFALFRAALTLNPVTLIMRQQAALLREIARGRSNAGPAKQG